MSRRTGPFSTGPSRPAPFRPGRLRVPGVSDPDAEAVRSTFESEYLELRVRTVLERSRVSGRAGGWALDPYQGSEWEDPFEAERSCRRSLDRSLPRVGRRRIFVKTHAAEILRRQLSKTGLRGRSITLGGAADPYQPAEKHFQVTRSLLEVLLEHRGLSLAIETRSPLIVRDLDLLAELDTRHAVEVTLPLSAAQPTLAGRLEPLAPPSDARLRTVAKLSQEGISTRILCQPLLPGINSSEAVLAPLFEAARGAGARDVMATPFAMTPSARTWFFSWLEGEFPREVSRYRELFSWRDHLPPRQRELVMAPFERLRLEAGFPRATAGRG